MRITYLIAATAVAAATLAATPAEAADPITRILTASQVDTSSTRSAGHVEFAPDGLDVWTDDASSEAKAAALWSHKSGIPSAVSLAWRGTQPQPGTNVVFDLDGDRSNDFSFNTLVGEPVYGDRFWMTGGAARAAERGITCPSTDGGNGSDCHGTLAEWQAALPGARVYAVGFSLGSGVKGDGTVRSMVVDETTYRFDGRPMKTQVVPTYHTDKWKNERTEKMRFRYSTDSAGPNESLLKRVYFVAKCDGKMVWRDRANFFVDGDYRHKFRKGTGAHTCVLRADGKRVEKLTVHTGRR